MKADLNNKLIVVIRVRGRIGVRRTIKETLNRLNVKRVNNLTLIFGTKSNLGMLEKCKDFVTYGIIDEAQLADLFDRKGMKVAKEDISALVAGKKNARDVVKIPITMHPPRRGYEGTKRAYSTGGALGYRGDEIIKLINRMAQR